ncbi:MAG: hypothetical protein ACJAYG_002606 [Oceanicoccus sp.]|jgi:hypothetical protein
MAGLLVVTIDALVLASIELFYLALALLAKPTINRTVTPKEIIRVFFMSISLFKRL